MSNKSVWLLCVGLVGVIGLALLLALPSMLKADDNQPVISATEFTRLYKEALITPLTKAANETKDAQLASFSQKLINSYELDKTASNVNEQSSLSDVLPDLVKINKVALEMPLKEAGKQIQDKEISEFYNRFVTKCGVE
jgi:hypothetical protein